MDQAHRAARADHEPRSPDDPLGRLAAGREVRPRQLVTISPLFGFVQIELPGALPLEDGRYLERQGELNRVLVLETEGAMPPARRKRRRPRQSNRSDSPTTVTVTTITLVRAHDPLGSETEAKEWLARLGDDDFIQALFDETFATIDRAFAAEAAATGRPYAQSPLLDQVLSARIGYGGGDQVVEGRYSEALEVDARGGTASPRRERLNRTRPLARIAAILGESDHIKACELLIPRVRADLDAGRVLTAALAAETALRATVVEMDGALAEADHERDLDLLEAMLPDLTQMTDALLAKPEVWAGLAGSLEEPLTIAERVIRRHRVLTQ